MIHPSKSYTINFTPCEHSDTLLSYYELSLNIYIEHSVRGISYRKRSTENFNYTTKDYFELAFLIVRVPAATVFKDYIINGGIEYDNFDDYISLLNKLFDLGLDYFDDSNLDYYDEGESFSIYIDNMIQRMEAESIDIFEYMLNEFVLKGLPNEVIGEKEEEYIRHFFDISQRKNYLTKKWMDENVLHAQYRITIRDQKIGVNISSDILRKSKSTKEQQKKRNKYSIIKYTDDARMLSIIHLYRRI